MKWSGVAGGSAALVGTTAHLGMPGSSAAAIDGVEGVDKTVWNSCLVNCGSRCVLRFQVKDGTIVRELADNTGTHDIDDPQLRPCVRGRSLRRRVYDPDRIKRPMRRKPGTPRGGGEWEEISWDEAMETIASEYKRVVDTYGQEAIYNQYASGVTGGNIILSSWSRLLSQMGGYVGWYGSYSTSQITRSMPFMYGARYESNSIADTKHSSLVIYWGNNPIETRMSGGNNMWNAQKTRADHQVRTIVIDPRYSDTAATVADEWIPILPGTDAALVAAIAHVMISGNMHDQEFLDKYCIGFDEDHMPEGAPKNASYRSYVEGLGPDGVEKTPEWAADITGIPANKIRSLAHDIATSKPCSILQGWGPQRQANGEYSCRAIMILPLLTGNVGINGGGNGSREGTIPFPLARLSFENPVTTMIPSFKWSEAIDHGTELTATKDGVVGRDRLKSNFKMLFNIAGNITMNQHSDLNKTRELLLDESKCEMIVTVDTHMCASAQYSDIVLPSTTNAEEVDFIGSEYAGDTAYAIYVDQAIEPLHDTMSHYDMCTLLAEKMGIKQEFTEGRTQEEWRSYLMDETRNGLPELWSEEEFKEKGVFRINNPEETFVANRDFREDPESNPLNTPSGLIEIYSQQLADLAKEWEFPNPMPGDVLIPLPEYVPTWEGVEEARTNEKHPLQCIGHHFKGRTHSSYATIDWTVEAHPHRIWISTKDAVARGISDGDLIEVYNDRGRISSPAQVTPRIIPGVISVPQGTWYALNKDGVDEGGCINTLTKIHASPLSKGNPQHTNLVQVELA